MVALAGFILSGPAAFLLVSWLSPQPAWQSAAVFVENYSSLQNLPYYFGFLLIGGMLMLIAAHYLHYPEKDLVKFQLLVALGCGIAFFTMIAFNYVAQTTFVHNLALHYRPEYEAAISSFSMANPLSFCWANEMWGYAFLGVATWLMAAYYRPVSTWIRLLLVSNGVLSILSALWTVYDVNWVLTTAGLVAYFVWNLLMIVMMTSMYRHFTKPNSYENTAEPLRAHPGAASHKGTGGAMA